MKRKYFDAEMSLVLFSDVIITSTIINDDPDGGNGGRTDGGNAVG